MIKYPAVPRSTSQGTWTEEDIAAWRERCALTVDHAARAVGYSRRALLGFMSGAQPIPMRAQLAMQQYEATMPPPSPAQRAAWQAEQVPSRNPKSRNPKNRVAPAEEATSMETEIEERIRARAYAIWEQEGRPDGKHLEHWSRAKRLIAAEELRAAAGGLVTHPATASHVMTDGEE